MQVILVPARLRLAAAILFLCVPLAAIETVIVTRAPWWRLPYRSIGIWSLSVALICLPLSAWLMRGKRFALRGVELFFCTWIILNFWVAFRIRNSALGFYTLLLMALFLPTALWIRRELARTFFDPQMRWFQGLPKTLPGLICRVSWGDRQLECRVSRLDREGAFVFHPRAGSFTGLKPDAPSALEFRYRERSVQCPALPIRALPYGRGVGFQFGNMTSDSRKQLGDFIETLRGEGYAL